MTRPGEVDLEVNVSGILVTGGTGSLGGRVADRLHSAGHDVRRLSRSGRSGTVRGDLLTGEGLDRAVRGVDVIVHCASNPRRKMRETDFGGTERLLREAARADVPHVVYISIVGVDRNPYYPYYRVKLETERLIESSPVPWTILRATQFHEFVLGILEFLERMPVMPLPRRFLLQPIDIGEVADRLVELALADSAGRVPDVGGPKVQTMAELARAYLGAIGRRRKVLEVPLPGKFFRAAREGAMVCPEGAYGEIRWEDFLSERFGSS